MDIQPTVWISSRDAVSRVQRATGDSPSRALHAIIAYAKTGHIQARALAIETRARGGKTRELRNEEIPLHFWQHCTGYDSSALDWQSGVFAGKGYISGQSLAMTLTGVQFDAAGIDILDPPQTAAAKDYVGGPMPIDPEHDPHSSAYAQDEPSVATFPKKGGRRPAEFWDDMWAAIASDLYDGALTPKTQADIERAMLYWIESHGHSAAVSTVRSRARRLWDRITGAEA